MRKLTRYVTYVMGNFANTIAYQIFGNRIQFYYVDLLGLNATLAGVIWMIYGLLRMTWRRQWLARFWGVPVEGRVGDVLRVRVVRW